MAPKSQTRYQKGWEKEFSWVQSCGDNHFKARCKLCKADFNVESMGRSALLSHAKGKKHSDIEKAGSSTHLPYFMPKIGSEPTSSPSHQDTAGAASNSTTTSSSVEPTVPKRVPSDEVSTQAAKPSCSTSTEKLDKYRYKDEVTSAEIQWCLHNVMTHSSLRTSALAVTLFPSMFPDSDIAKSMTLQKDKLAYSVTYGISPYLRTQLEEKMKSAEFFVFGFDESMNEVAQMQQMDVTVRLWDIEASKVTSRYLTSVFMNSCTAENLLSGLEKALQPEKLPGVVSKVLQFSMDGPNVNFKLLRLFREKYRSQPDAPQLLELGSCGLHVVNGAFRTGFKKTGWDIEVFLSSMFYLFEGSPARRGHFTNITDCKLFPFRFCGVRWTENGKVSRRAAALLKPLQKYVAAVKGTDKEPSCKSFQTVKACLKDRLLPAKLAFFESLAEDVEIFLREFQSDVPMAPFLSHALETILKTTMKRIVKGDVMDSTPIKSIDVFKTVSKTDKTYVNLLPASKIDLGYATRIALRDCENVSSKDILQFRQDCRTCLQSFIGKMLERSPLKYPLTKALTFLNPGAVASDQEEAVTNMVKAMDLLAEARVLSPSEVQNADREYRGLLEKQSVLHSMRIYDRKTKRLDTFWVEVLSEHPDVKYLPKVVKICLCLSHGNAFLERGFSVNSEILVENLQEESLVAQRRIFDFVTSVGGVQNVKVTKQMVLSMRNAYSRFKDALEQKRKENAEKEKAAENQKRAASEVEELNKKRLKIQQDAENEVNQIDDKIRDLKMSIAK